MNITYTPVDITARVRDHNGQKDLMFDLIVVVDCVDQDSGTSVFYQLHHRFNTEHEYDENQPFVPFEDIEEEHVNQLVQNLIATCDHMHNWVEERINALNSEPVVKKFSFQMKESEPVGIGSTPVIDESTPE